MAHDSFFRIERLSGGVCGGVAAAGRMAVCAWKDSKLGDMWLCEGGGEIVIYAALSISVHGCSKVRGLFFKYDLKVLQVPLNEGLAFFNEH